MNIIREEYLNKLIALKDKHIIKIVTGIRRCGKSTLFELYQDYLVNNGVLSEQIISINFEDYDSMHYFQDYILKAGLIDALKEAGAMPGDTIRIKDIEFDFFE